MLSIFISALFSDLEKLADFKLLIYAEMVLLPILNILIGMYIGLTAAGIERHAIAMAKLPSDEYRRRINIIQNLHNPFLEILLFRTRKKRGK